LLGSGTYRRNVPPASGPFLGAAVLVHGLWGNPHDWRWVRAQLEDADVLVITPDLPSHSTPTAGLVEDAAEVRQAIRACAPPVAAVGWSYGGSVISLAGAGEGSISRLIYIADIPRPAGFPGEDLSWIDADPLVLVHPDGRFVLDNDRWLSDGDARTFPAELRRHLRDHPRRLVTRATLGAQQEAAWEVTATTVLIGERDSMLSEADRRLAEEHLNDVRVIDADHFIIFRHPELVAQLVLEALSRRT
jgi:pimeloyl-ACP methyl ester carboxylesterase